MDIETLIEVYSTLKQYIPTKDRQEAADNLMSIMVDMLSDQDLQDVSETDSSLARAYKEYVGEDEPEEIDEFSDE